jgi:hypothetical protein
MVSERFTSLYKDVTNFGRNFNWSSEATALGATNSSRKTPEKLTFKTHFFASRSMIMCYPARQRLAETMQAMVCKLFTSVDQKAGRKSITYGARS